MPFPINQLSVQFHYVDLCTEYRCLFTEESWIMLAKAVPQGFFFLSVIEKLTVVLNSDAHCMTETFTCFVTESISLTYISCSCRTPEKIIYKLVFMFNFYFSFPSPVLKQIKPFKFWPTSLIDSSSPLLDFIYSSFNIPFRNTTLCLFKIKEIKMLQKKHYYSGSYKGLRRLKRFFQKYVHD